MGADSGSEQRRRVSAGTHRRSGQTLIRRRDHDAPRRLRRPSLPAPSASALVGIAVLVLIAVGVVHLSGSGSAVPVREAPTGQEESVPDAAPGPLPEATTAAGASTTSSTTPAGSSPPSRLVVHVSGAVAAPGVVRLPGGARVDDALEAAGGPTSEADLSAINLARPLADGEQIHVPVPGEQPRSTPPGPGAADGQEAAPGEGTPIDLNTAGAAELEELPGVGPAIAGRIIEHREKNGPFTSVDGLLEVSGIGPATLEDLRGQVRV